VRGNQKGFSHKSNKNQYVLSFGIRIAAESEWCAAAPGLRTTMTTYGAN